MLFRFFFKKIKCTAQKRSRRPLPSVSSEALWFAEEYWAAPFSVRLVGLFGLLGFGLEKNRG